MSSVDSVVLGTLPSDLLAAVEGGSISVTPAFTDTVGNEGVAVSESLITFTHAPSGRTWEAVVKFMDSSAVARMTVQGVGDSSPRVVDTSRCVFIQDSSWVRRTLPAPSPLVDDTKTPLLSNAPQTVAVGKEPATEGAVCAQFYLGSPDTQFKDCQLSDLLVTHRQMIQALAQYLAPADRRAAEVLENITTRTQLAGKYSPADVLYVLSLLTDSTQQGKLGLNSVGTSLVDIERYETKKIKQLVANRALPKLKDEKYAEAMHRMELYADRDVVLSVRTNGGGIMAGLGTSKRGREEETDSAHSGSSHGEDEHHMEERHSPKVQIDDIRQCGVAWEEGDLCLQELSISHHAQEIIHLREKLRQAMTAEQGVGETMPSGLYAMPITTDQQLMDAKPHYATLHAEHARLHQVLMRHEEITAAARRWCARNGPERYTANLSVQLRDWSQRQEEPRRRLCAAYERLRKALYLLQSEMTDYVDLHDVGVL